MSGQVLYRKHRPQSFNELIGQKHIKDILIESIKKGAFSHAYLFSGPRGTGKTTTARLMSKALNCLNFPANSDVCNECENCLLINNGSAIDIIEMDAASNRGIEEIRTLKENVNFLPNNLKYKIYIIDEVHMLTKEAFNALLKTLEEPPAHVIFIMATTEPQKLPMTILSRVQRYDFSLGSEAEVVTKLKAIVTKEKIKYDEEALAVIYKYSGGSFRDAESLLAKVINNLSATASLDKPFVSKTLGLIEEDILENFVKAIYAKDSEKALDQLENINRTVSDLAFFITQLIAYLQELLVAAVRNEGEAEFDKVFVIKAIQEMIRAKSEIRFFDNKKLLIQMAVVNLTSDGGSDVVRAAQPKPKSPDSTDDQDGKDKIRNTKSETRNKDQKSEDIVEKSDIRHPKSDISSYHNFHEVIRGTENFDARLKSILLNSQIDLVDNEFIVTNEYQFNVNFLLRPNITRSLAELVKNITNTDVKIVVRRGEIIGKVAEVVLEEFASVSEAEAPENFDNSNLVEGVL